MLRPLKEKNLGVTLAELMVVIVIIGGVAVFAIPRYNTLMEKMTIQEQIQLLYDVLAAQHSYRLDHPNATHPQGIYALGPAWVTLNEYLNIPSQTNYFSPILLGCGSNIAYCPVAATNKSCNGVSKGYMAYTARKPAASSPYTLYLLEDSRVVCSSTAILGDCNSSICKKLGFPTSW